MARKGDTPEYINKMQQEVFEVLAQPRSLEELRRVEPNAKQVYRKYLDWLNDADVRDLVIQNRRVSRLKYSYRCVEASAVQAYQKGGLPIAPGMEIGYVVKDAKKWDVGLERNVSEFDAGYYCKLLEKAWDEVAFMFKIIPCKDQTKDCEVKTVQAELIHHQRDEEF